MLYSGGSSWYPFFVVVVVTRIHLKVDDARCACNQFLLKLHYGCVICLMALFLIFFVKQWGSNTTKYI